ncbi:MAG: sugar transferase [Pyrinomonadaceae bacterium]|nr:sugar transferase [Sphingobacteriaceae bacterium]
MDENTDNIFSVAAQYGIKDVYLSLSLIEIKNINNLMSEAENQCVRLKLVPDFNSASSYNVNSMANFTVITHRKDPLETLPNRFKKRLFDIALSSIVIIFILSWLFPILAILIKIQNPGPILLKQIRCGRNNKPFMCFSFRSIKINVENKTKQAAIGCYNVDAPAVGKFIRRTGLDKFPQFLNVLAGNMSIVGPKPHSIKHTEIYGAIEEQFMVRQFLKPGIIGWAQLKEFRGETNQKSLIKKRIGHDIWYMERWSELLDLKIIWCTIASRIQIKRKAMKTRKPTEYVTA